MQEKTLDIRYLKGVGPKKSEMLKKLRINTVEDILYYLPRRYEDRSNLRLVKDLKAGEHQVLRGKILKTSSYRTKRGINVFQAVLGDKTGVVYCAWFNQPFLKKLIKIGEEVIVYGKVERCGKLQLNHPEYEIVKDRRDLMSMGKIVPVYSLTEDVSQRYIRFLVHEAVERFAPSITENLSTDLRGRKRLADIRFAIRNIHFPLSFANLEKAYRRLVFEEFFVLQLALALRKKDIKRDTSGISHNLDKNLIEFFKKLFPFEFTKCQLKAINEIEHDMADSRPMNRLLEGDVGSGKTAVAIYALLLTVQNSYQAVLMAPTEILARQHFINISELLMPLGVNVRLLVSGLADEKKLQIKDEMKRGEINIAIGTHALIWEGVEFNRLGLVVVDEQHKFGVNQRHLLRKKGFNPDVLIMTATPIPRTLALTVYGDLDISVIKELPEGRYPVKTYCLEENKREMIYKFIREEVRKGRQAYIVYPRIWSAKKSLSKEGSLKAAAHMYNKLQEEVFPDLKIGLIHGKMSTGEKETVMKRFAASVGKDKRIDILISTTVIEVGIDVSNASLMVVENAERFGLSQLHQLRGRIGRGGYPSYCILLGNPKTEAAKKRFYTMSQTRDGFKVAEEDLELRGPGEFFGTKQHGLPELRFGNILKDFEIMEEARQEAFRLVREDPLLKNPKNTFTKKALKKRFSGKLELIHVG